MRLHISLDDELIDALDSRVGRRRRSAFIAATIRQALEDQRRWDEIEAALGSLQNSEHDWDRDPAGWVRSQRRGDRRRVG
jgi:metal-responsive CopG/Arc/MetJ family transcriptional regulator